MKFKFVTTILISGILLSACGNVAPTTWGYGEDNGPDKWAEISDENEICASGAMQSPIDIVPTLTKEGNIDIKYTDSKLEVVDKGYTFELESSNDNIVTYDDQNWYLEQLHFHNPSENTIEGKTYPLEVHFVNKNDNGDILVVSNFIDQGEENTAFGSTFTQKDGEEVDLDLMKAFNLDGEFYSFNGSLTTPPCTENVKWVVMKDPAIFSQEQIEDFTNNYASNARGVQKTNDREIYQS